MSLEGIADLPLHDGHVPQWLARIMKRLAKAILEIMVEEFGPDKIVERFSNPLWFQAFNNIIGMDWDSSGATTVTTGILKEITWKYPELGILILGGKGERARNVPGEVPKAIDILGLSDNIGRELVESSRLIAKIDSSMVQDGYSLYHHTLFVSEKGYWSIVQQGMNPSIKMARRYHWIRDTTYFIDPHKAIAGYNHGNSVLNLVSRESMGTQKTILDLVREKPENIIDQYTSLIHIANKQRSLQEYITPTKTGVVEIKKAKKIVYYKPLPIPKKLLEKLKKIYDVYPSNLKELLLIKGIGASTLRALALISDLVYNEPPSWKDPVNTPYDPFKYAYAIGGKDGIPYPVKKDYAEKIIITLEDIVKQAKLGNKERLYALKRLRKLRLYTIK